MQKTPNFANTEINVSTIQFHKKQSSNNIYLVALKQKNWQNKKNVKTRFMKIKIKSRNSFYTCEKNNETNAPVTNVYVNPESDFMQLFKCRSYT